MRMLFLPLLLSLCAGDAAALKADAWRNIASTHFEIYHEDNWTPSGISMEMEKIYGQLRLDMSMFAPWMLKEKTKVYIYSGQKSYVNGEFEPPEWSRGMAYCAKRTIVVYDNKNRAELNNVLTHELTHLFFESFFSEQGKTRPPAWLNEGLAVKMEDAVDGGLWTRALGHMAESKIQPFSKHFDTDVKAVSSTEAVSAWYTQSFGIVKFLARPEQRLKFKNFCSMLRDGKELEDALWLSYRYRTVSALESAWLEWAYNKKDQGKNGRGVEFSSSQFKQMQFKPLLIEHP